ncbi:hypothetical protein L0222_10130 [bacterium]|nr:hypothetical protein [bacterium]MCI0604622.1 hypothetical protein [bacterium]
MSKLIVEIAEKTHQELRETAARKRRTVREVVTELLEEYLTREKNPKRIRSTGLCGKWDDSRPTEEIIASIKSGRNWFRRSSNSDV